MNKSFGLTLGLLTVLVFNSVMAAEVPIILEYAQLEEELGDLRAMCSMGCGDGERARIKEIEYILEQGRVEPSPGGGWG